jgi:hypothetical protein
MPGRGTYFNVWVIDLTICKCCKCVQLSANENGFLLVQLFIADPTLVILATKTISKFPHNAFSASLVILSQLVSKLFSSCYY